MIRMDIANKLSALYRLTRFDHALMIVIAIIIGMVIALGRMPVIDSLFFIALAVPVLIEMGAFALNDFLDREADKINKRKDRPLVTGDISEEIAVQIAFLSFMAGGVLSVFLPFAPMFIACSFGVFAILYDMKLKEIPLMGNLYIGLSMGIPFIYGNYLYSETIVPTSIILFIIAVIIGFAREILKSVEDVEGDVKARGAKTLPVMIGEKNAVNIAKALMLIFIPLSVYPFASSFISGQPGLVLGTLSMPFLIAAEVLVLFSVITAGEDVKSLRKIRKVTLAAMILGTLAILLSVLGV